MPKYTFKVGDKVKWQQYEDEWIDGFSIEKEYDCGDVYLIGNEHTFCDMVPGHHLRMQTQHEKRT